MKIYKSSLKLCLVTETQKNTGLGEQQQSMIMDRLDALNLQTNTYQVVGELERSLLKGV